MTQPSTIILGTGSYAPSRVLTNAELSTMVDTNEEWILSRSGIRERRIAAPGESVSDMGAAAGRRALEDAGIRADQIDLVVVATVTPDLPMPAVACIIQHKLGVPDSAACFDVNAACSGYLYALDTACAMVGSGRYHHALVIGVEKMSAIVDWKDRSTCVLFGDGAGASVIGTTPQAGVGLIGTRLGTYGESVDLLQIPGGGSDRPASQETVAAGAHFIKMRGREVYKAAIRVMEGAAREILEQHTLSANHISLVIPHQANLRIIESISEYLEIPMERFFVNLDRYGNTSAASVPIALDEARRAGRIKPGDITLLIAFGAGLTYGSALIRW